MIKSFIQKNPPVFKIARKLYIEYSYIANKAIIAKNKDIKGICAGKRCFIVGNGPSINLQDLAKLKNESVFVCNLFYHHPQINIINPAFYSFIEPIAISDNFRENAFPEIISRINAFALSSLDTNFLFNIQYKKYIDANGLFKNNKINYFIFDGKISNHMSLEMEKPNPSGRASIYFMLSAARYLGFKNIYILGCDSDHILDGYYRHFYGDDVSKCKKLTRLESAKILHDDLTRLDIMNRFFQKEGIHIFNAGVGGMIDTFPRVEYDSLF